MLRHWITTSHGVVCGAVGKHPQPGSGSWLQLSQRATGCTIKLFPLLFRQQLVKLSLSLKTQLLIPITLEAEEQGFEFTSTFSV